MYLNWIKENKKCQLVTSWTWEHYDIGLLCPKIALDIDLPPQLPRKGGGGGAEAVPLAMPVNRPKLS